jgi:hypothetical protein
MPVKHVDAKALRRYAKVGLFDNTVGKLTQYFLSLDLDLWLFARNVMAKHYP